MFLHLKITALCVIPMKWQYWVLVVVTIVVCGSIFNLLSFFGQRMLNEYERKEKEQAAMHAYDNSSVAVTD